MLRVPSTGKKIHLQPYWMMEFKDKDNCRRFFRMEDQLDKASNQTLKFMQSMLGDQDEEEKIFYRRLQPPSSSSDSDPSENPREERPVPDMRAEPSRPTLPQSGPIVVRRDPIPCPLPLRRIPAAPRSQASVSGPLFQISEPPVQHHRYQRMRDERDYFHRQVLEMRGMRSAEADVARHRDRFRDQVGETRMRLRVVRTLVETRLHGLATSREGETTVGMREILDFAMREIGEIVRPALWETRDDDP
ncbi:hypothetical protein POM88_035973 [Heracleum sosnowskyi]|uniref:Uncharacterized protein n=1 Tax=Heracleum sosnowskyi TaxID=360622 RepID=A0AAD8HNF4_9APIA|nr:hypothetical protein POM88_035973 [Heracleum sosnowskyi]